MSLLPLAPRNRSGGLPTSLVSPRVDRHFMSSETNRWFYPFNRATAEAGIDTRQRLETRRARLFSGNAPSKSDRIRLDKKRGSGVSPAVFPPTFGRPKVGPGRGGGAPTGKHPGGLGARSPRITRGLGPERPHKEARGCAAPKSCVPARPAAGESKPVGQMRPPSRWEAGGPARRRANQPCGAGEAPTPGGLRRLPPAAPPWGPRPDIGTRSVPRRGGGTAAHRWSPPTGGPGPPPRGRGPSR